MHPSNPINPTVEAPTAPFARGLGVEDLEGSGSTRLEGPEITAKELIKRFNLRV